MAKIKGYKIKKNACLKDFLDLGFQEKIGNKEILEAYEQKKKEALEQNKEFCLEPIEPIVSGCYKIFNVSKGSKAYKMVLDLFNDQKYQKEYRSILQELLDALNITFYEKELGVNNIKILVNEDEHFEEYATLWKLEYDFDDDFLTFTHLDKTFPFSYYDCEVLKEYCGDLIDVMLENKLIRKTKIEIKDVI